MTYAFGARAANTAAVVEGMLKISTPFNTAPMYALTYRGGDQPLAVLGAEHEVNQHASQRLRHT